MGSWPAPVAWTEKLRKEVKGAQVLFVRVVLWAALGQAESNLPSWRVGVVSGERRGGCKCSEVSGIFHKCGERSRMSTSWAWIARVIASFLPVSGSLPLMFHPQEMLHPFLLRSLCAFVLASDTFSPPAIHYPLSPLNFSFLPSTHHYLAWYCSSYLFKVQYLFPIVCELLGGGGTCSFCSLLCCQCLEKMPGCL